MSKSSAPPLSNERDSLSQPHEALDSLAIVVGEIAHDFNNILSLVFGYVEMALSEIPEGARARSDLEHVLAAGDRAKDLVERILTYSRQSRLKHSEIEPDKAVLQALAWLEDRLPANVRLRRDIAQHGALLLSHNAELHQLVVNLCNNSLQAMPPEGGEILVKLDYFGPESTYWRTHDGLEKRAYARLSVCDNGSGMDIFTQEKMYNPFFTTARGAGEEHRAGLGLTTVFNIVAAHQGVIFVDSEVGRGTVFEICLPLAQGQAAAPLPGSSTADATLAEQPGRHILFVDDESSITEMTRQILEQQGYRVSPFNDPHLALDAFRHSPRAFDLVITDLVMPFMSGTALALEISSLQPDIPIILTTGMSDKITRESCQHWGIDEVLNKPFTLQELLGIIGRQLSAQVAEQ